MTLRQGMYNANILQKREVIVQGKGDSLVTGSMQA